MLMARLRRELPTALGDPARGQAVFDKHCAQCHRFAGKGHDVGPNLDGAERSPEYLLVNIVDPNRVVGTPYYSRTVVLKSGKLVTGLLVEEDPQTLRLKRENNVLEVIPKADIDEHSTSTKSLMPEGLSNNMTVQDLRDLIRYLEARK
jgi:putative heme-binding domain-containing protein